MHQKKEELIEIIEREIIEEDEIKEGKNLNCPEKMFHRIVIKSTHFN